MKNITIEVKNKSISFGYEYENIMYLRERGKLVQRRSYDDIQDISGNLLLLVGRVALITIKDEEFKLLECSLRESNGHKYLDLVLEPKKIANEPLTLAKVAAKKREELKEIRDRKISEDIEVDGNVFKIENKDIETFWELEYAVRKGVLNEFDTKSWILANNEVKELTVGELLKVIEAKGLRKQKLFEIFLKLEKKVSQAQSIEDIESIKWDEKVMQE